MTRCSPGKEHKSLKRFIDAAEIGAQAQADPKRFVLQCEAEFRLRVLEAAEAVLSRPGVRLVMLAGPSSSGKTTTARRLKDALLLHGVRAHTISLDDFYLDPSEPLLFEDGTPDYETVHSLDLPCLERTLGELLKHNRCLLPRFNFEKRQREETLEALTVEKDDLVIVEGLHALNPLICDPLDRPSLFKLYVSVSSRVTNDGSILFTKRDLRFIRRMVRDYQFRASPVEHTFYLWGGVRKGEDRYLFPFSDRADLRIDSIHPYEPCVFRDEATALLSQLPPGTPYEADAALLRRKLAVFPAIDQALVPADSLLHEFLG